MGDCIKRDLLRPTMARKSCVGKRYLITVGPKLNKGGQPTGWSEVTACIPLPTKKQ